MAVVSIILGYRLTKPINKLALVAKKIGDGDLNVSEVPVSKDEIGQLGKSMKNMADSLKYTLIRRDELIDEVESHRQTSEALRESEEKLQALFSAMTEMVVLHELVFDENGMPCNYRILDCNQAFCRITGIKKETAVGKTATQFYKTETPPYLDVYAKVALSSEPTEFFTEYAPLEKHFLVSVVSPRKHFFATITSDITEVKQAEEALRKQLNFSESLIETAQTIILMLDPQGRIVRFNPYMEELVGYDLDEVKGKDWFETFIKPENGNSVKSVFKKAIDDIQTRGNVNPIIAKDGRTILVEWHDKTLKDRDGRTEGILAIGYDITERKRAEAEKEKLQTQLSQAHKMESVGRLAGGVAHDFNNMLGVILGHVEFALEKAEQGHELHADLKEIQTAATRSAAITKQLLAFARKQTISPKQIDLNDTVETMLNMLRRLIGEDIDLVWKPFAYLWPVKMDPSQIDQILANLCVNARDAISGVGKLTIETGRKTFDEAYCKEHPGFIPGDFVLLAVSDNGCGMDKDTLDNLFEPFFTTKEVGKGTGLGLATIYGIVKQNNGFINVYSEPGQGTTFKIYLPRLVADEDMDKAVPEKKAAAGGTETILLVEDEPAILRMTRMMLERKGYSVLPAATPGEAIDLAKTHADKIHLLMSDVVMPEMNGRDLAGQITALYPGIRLLFMSGYTADVIAHQGILDEGVAFIQKPFSMADMTVKVREILDKASDETQV